jgi:hypothetical protein
VAAERPRWRRQLALAVLVGGVALQLTLSLVQLGDPHARFGFRPFPAADTWWAEIDRVDAAGSRRSVDDGTWEYDWDALVGAPGLLGPGRERFANRGGDATVDLLRLALDWVAANTPDDTTTLYLEAAVHVRANGSEVTTTVLRSEPRVVP